MKKRLSMVLAAVWIGCLLIPSGTHMAERTVVATVAARYETATESGSGTVTEAKPEADSGAESETGPGSRTEEGANVISAGTRQTAESGTASSSVSNQVENAVPEGMETAAENEFLVLYVHPGTTEIAVLDKRSKAVWYSNPPDREEDTIATGYNKAKLNVQFELTYFDSAGNSMKYDNYTHSVENGQFVMEKQEDGVSIVYTLGEVQSDIDAIPKYISEERFRTVILDKIEDPKDKREVEKRFRYDQDNQRYERRDSSFKGVGLTKVTQIFDQIGYDEAQRAIDEEAYGEAAAGNVSLEIPLHYQLEGDRLKVTVATGNIVYPETMRIQSLTLLPFFGASGLDDEGYTLVPDGSGALVHFNNGKTYTNPFRTTMYGSDAALTQPMKIQKDKAARLPVFGMKYEDRGFLAIIEKGDAVASVEADVSGRLNVYNTVNSSFTLHHQEEVTLTNGWRSNTVKRFQAEPFRGDIVVSYGFLGAEEASYSGMAEYYRTYLIEQGSLRRLEMEEDVPFYVELAGGIPKKKFFLGVPYNAYEPLTTFDQAESILAHLHESGIGNIKLRYKGWFNGGINHDLPGSVAVDKKLGGKKGLEQLKAYAEANRISLFPDAAFMETAPGADGFKKSKQASRLITGKPAPVYPYRMADFRQDDEKEPGYVVSPKALPGMLDGFLADYGRLGVSGLSLRDMGSKLNSDFNRSEVIDREEAKEIVVKQLEQVRGTVAEILVEGGNAYITPYAQHIVNAPDTSSGFNITDESVPFFQLVFHGYVHYAGSPWNLTVDQDSAFNLLKALETGSAPYYSWFYADSSAIKMTGFDHLFSADYRNWIDEAAANYREVNRVLADVQAQTIQDHRKLAEGVYQTTFEQGKTIIVNYNDRTVNVNGITIEAKHYWVGGEPQS